MIKRPHRKETVFGEVAHECIMFQLVIEGIVSEGSQGKLALDELILVDGPCVDTGKSVTADDRG